MKRPHLPAMPMIPASSALPPSCFKHGPHGTTGYCPACAVARIDTDRAMFPDIRIDYRRQRPAPVAAIVATLVGLTALAVVIAAYALILTGALTWHH